MELLIEDGPSGASELLARAVNDLAPPTRVERMTAAVTGGSAARVSRPIPIYTLGLDDLTQPQPLAKASLSGWRYVAWNGRQALAIDLAGRGPEDLRLNQMLGPGAAGRLIEAAERAESLSKGQGKSLLRILAAPALQLEALWVTAEQGGEAFFPLRSSESSDGEIDFVGEALRLIDSRRASVDEAEPASAEEPSELGA